MNDDDKNIYIPLRVHSPFSLLEGAIKIPKLADFCKSKGIPACAITDTANLCGAAEFSETLANNGIQPIIGVQANITPINNEQTYENKIINPDILILLVKNKKGYLNLSKIMSISYLASNSALSPQITIEDLAENSEGLIALTGGVKGGFGRLLLEGKGRQAEEYLLKLKQIFKSSLYIEISRHGLDDEKKIENEQIQLAYKHNIPLVATNEAFFITEDMFEAHDALLCIADKSYVEETNRRQLTPDFRLKTSQEMIKLFEDIPEAILNTAQIAKRCGYKIEPSPPLLPPFGEYATEEERALREAEILKENALKGLKKRLEKNVLPSNIDKNEAEKISKPYFDRLDMEISVINKMGFAGYFLIVADFINWAKNNGCPVGPGRGSGAGSIVAWSLMITDLDPLRFNLLFERFLNPERVNMPDFDVDFCQENRYKVIDYVQKKYGFDRVAQIITFGKLQAKAVIRDVGRVLQIPYNQVDKIAKLIPLDPTGKMTLEKALELEPELREAVRSDPSIKNMIDIAKKLEGLYRHASTHAAGLVIGDRDLYNLVPLYKDPSSDMPVTQFDMKWVEATGLIKFDFLGLKTLSVIAKTLEFIKETRNISFDISDIPLDDKETYELLCRAETLGVFQLESSGMKDILRKLKPSCLEEIIAIVSLYRPGPMENIPSYINRKHGKENVDYLHPKLEGILKETYGIMIYQEQVMQIAQVLAGYSLGEADLLRRAMGKKKVAEMEKHRKIFCEGALKNGVDEEVASSIFSQMEKFAGYGFNKSHAAAYALIAYQTAYLKTHYKIEFLAANMNYEMNNTDKLLEFKEDAISFGIKIFPPDINKSLPYFKVEEEGIRYALSAIKNVGEGHMEVLIQDRLKNGEFKNLDDFIARIDSKNINKRQLEYLIKSGALLSLHHNSAELFENLDYIINYASLLNEEKNSAQVSLFSSDKNHNKLELVKYPSWSTLEALKNEAEAIGFYLSSHPLDEYEKSLHKIRVIKSSDLLKSVKLGGSAIVKLAAITHSVKKRISKTGSKFAIGEFSDAGGTFSVMLFSECYDTSRELLESGIPLVITLNASIRSESDELRLSAIKVEALDKAIMQISSGIIIKFNDIQTIEKIHQFLLPKIGKGNKVIIAPIVDNWNVEIALPNQYKLKGDDIINLRKIEGILEIIDI